MVFCKKTEKHLKTKTPLQFFLDLSTSPPLASKLRPCLPERWATCWATDLLSSNWFWTNTALLAGPVWLGRSSMLWLLEDQVRLIYTCSYYVSVGMEALTVDRYQFLFDVRYRHSIKKCQVLKRQFFCWGLKLISMSMDTKFFFMSRSPTSMPNLLFDI